MKGWTLGLLGSIFLLGACGGGVSPGAPADLTLVTASVQYLDPPGLLEIPLTSAATQVASDQGVIVVGSAEGVSAVYGLDLVPMSVYAEQGEPLTTGAVRVLASRVSGVMVAAENGLFHSFNGSLLFSPLSAAVSELDVAHMAFSGEGEGEAFWFSGTDGLFRVFQSSMMAVDIVGEDGAPTGLAANGQTLLVAYGERLYEVDLDTWMQWFVTDGAGAVVQIAERAGVFTVATSTGMLSRSEDGSYVHYELLEGTTPQGANATLYHSEHGAVGAMTSGIVAPSAAQTGLAELAHDGPIAGLAEDAYGNLWVAAGTALTGVMVGEHVGFEAEVAGILETHCAGCHEAGISGAPKHDFTNYSVALPLADDIIARISNGTMPPSGPLPAEEYETLIRWYTTGQAP